VAVLTPPSQVLVQLLGDCQLPTQSMGHGEVLQLDVYIAPALVQTAPPYDAGVDITKTVEPTPPLQVLVQLPEACQLPTQSIGQGVVLQVEVDVAELLVHAVPPYCAAVVMTYSEVRVPPPQVLAHSPWVCQLPTQLIAHGITLHCAVTANPLLRGQGFPPF
jgi:hypothetical protein